MIENCMLRGKDHHYEFYETIEGRSCWICFACGDVAFQMEDAGHGG